MARLSYLKNVRKAGAFVGSELAAGEIGVNTSADRLMFSTDASDVLSVGNVVFVSHGGTAGTARPEGGAAIVVIWLGTVTPSNMITNDLYVNTT